MSRAGRLSSRRAPRVTMRAGVLPTSFGLSEMRAHFWQLLSWRWRRAFGQVPSDTLNPQKARILLMLALTNTNDAKEIRRIFSE